MDLEEEVKCPICLDYLIAPVTLDCGHNFCKDCISQYCEKWEEMGEDVECPLCNARFKKGNFRQNWQLADVAEKIKCLGKAHLCERHKEKLHLFCKEDQELVCLICERSPEHQSHTVQLLEEAAKECKDQLCSRLEELRKEKKKILANLEETRKESQVLLGQIEEKKTRTMAVFDKIQQFLEEKKKHLFLQLEEQKKEIETKKTEHVARLQMELSSLEVLIQQMEKKCQQPASELLQDIGRTLERYEKKEVFENPVAFPTQLTCIIKESYDVKHFLDRVIKLFPGCGPHMDRPGHIRSENCKSIEEGEEYQDLPDSPETSDTKAAVLGHKKFTSDKYFHDVVLEAGKSFFGGDLVHYVRKETYFHVRKKTLYIEAGRSAHNCSPN